MISAAKKFLIVSMAVMMAVMAVPTAAFANSPIVTGYSIETNPTAFEKGAHVTITVNITDNSITLDPNDPADQIDAYKILDSFRFKQDKPENIEVVVKSAHSYTVTFNEMVYSGEGKRLSFMVGCLKDPAPITYEQVDLTINEAREYEPPTPMPPEPSEPYVPDPAPQPTILIKMQQPAEPIKAGEEFELTFSFENLGKKTVENCMISYRPDSSFIVMGTSSKAPLEKIAPGKTVTATAKFKALSDISSEYLRIGISLSFSYFNNISTVSGSEDEEFNIPAVRSIGGSVVPEPVVIITHSELGTMTAGREYDLTVYFRNMGTVALSNIFVNMSVSGDIVLANPSSTASLPDIAAGGTGSVTLKIRTPAEISSSSQMASVNLKYYYESGSGLAAGNAGESFTLSSAPNRDDGSVIASPSPNIIITDFSGGAEAVAAGKPFDFSFTFMNTGSMAIENIVAVVDGGEAFTMNGSTNTFFYSRVAPGATQTQVVPMQTLATAHTGAQGISVSFQYEYVDNKTRSSGSANIRVTIPVYQEDRLEFGTPMLYDMAFPGMETTILFSYVNKGKSDVSNVEVSIEGDVSALQASQYLGNFSSGASGNISFVVTPYEPGEIPLNIIVNYEDANGNQVRRELPLTISVVEMPMPEYPEDWDSGFPGEEELPQGGFFSRIPWWGYLAAATAVIATIAVIAKAAKVKKARKAAAEAENEWNVFDEVNGKSEDKKEA